MGDLPDKDYGVVSSRITKTYRGYKLQCGANPANTGLHASVIYVTAMHIASSGFILIADWPDNFISGIKYAESRVDDYIAEHGE